MSIIGMSMVNMALSPSPVVSIHDHRLRMAVGHPPALHDVRLGCRRQLHHVVVVRAVSLAPAVDPELAILDLVGPVGGLAHADEIVDVLASTDRDVPRHREDDPAVGKYLLDDHRDAQDRKSTS